jgi:hypothetical protein
MRRFYRFLFGLLWWVVLWMVLLVVNQLIFMILGRETSQIPGIYWIFLCVISLVAGFLISFSLTAPPRDSSVVPLHEEGAD